MKNDPETEHFLKVLEEQERVRANRASNVRVVLVVLSARAMVFDRESLRQKILLSYPEATVFFRNTLGTPLGAVSPSKVDLVIDLTGPRQRRKLLYSRKLRGMGRVVIGRNAGLFRKRIYDKVYDETRLGRDHLSNESLQNRAGATPLEFERRVQKEVLALAGVPVSQMGDVPPDQGRTIALRLPPLRKA